MRELLRAALVIARRDYVATVWSKTFLLFLVGPLLPGFAVFFFGTIGSDIDKKAAHATVAVLAPAPLGDTLLAARERLAARLGGEALPDLAIVAPQPDAAAQTRALLADPARGITAVVRGGLEAPEIIGPEGAIAGNRGGLALIWDAARAAEALHARGAAPPPPVDIAARPVAAAAGNDASARMVTARLGQLLLMMLTMILAGMLLSNLIEEKSNKVIEVLAAAVPVDAIFLGKLIAMLGMSLTGIAVWGGAAALALFAFLPQAGAMPPPAVGWVAFAGLGIVYFVGCYLLLGALFLGIGAQASTVREVQTLSMPVTMAQLGVVGLASTVVGAPDSGIAKVAMIFPWSSPFAMIGRAALDPALWPHGLAILWQAAWIALIIKLASLGFRRSVLKSGRARRRWFGPRAAVR